MTDIAERGLVKTPSRRQRRLMVEECRALRITDLQRVYGQPPTGAEVAGWHIRTSRGTTDRLKVASTPGTFGGRYWWLVCPECGHRARILYRPPGATSRGCRSCLRLVYRSQYQGADASGTADHG